MNTTLTSSLEELEKNYWGEAPNDASYLISKCYLLRKKRLSEFDTEDLRVMISQNNSLMYLIPIALKVLENDILAEGSYYEGDLLSSVLTIDATYWMSNNDQFNRLKSIFLDRERYISTFDITQDIKDKLFSSFYKFQQTIKFD